MDLRRMQYFLALAEHLHFGQTASSLGISQPALSQQVHRLEEEFGAALLERGSRTVTLTTAGRVILDPLRRCLSAYGEARHVVREAATRDADDGSAKRLQIGFPGSEVGSGLLSVLLRKISEHLPDTRVEIVEACCQRQAAELRQRRIDAAFIHPPVLDAGVRAMRVRRDELVVLLPRNHPSAGTERVPIDCLAEEPFIDFQLPCPAYTQALSSLMRRSGLTPRIEYGSTGLSTIIEMVASRLGVAIVLGSTVRHAPQEIVVRPLWPESKGPDIAFVWQLKNPSPQLRKLQHLIHEIGTEPAQPAATAAGQPTATPLGGSHAVRRRPVPSTA